MNELLTASLEDYLEAIFHIIEDKQGVKPKDIAKRLKVSAASVTGALRSLADKKLINYAPYDIITLTPSGKEVAQDVIRRHEVLRDFFIKVLAVDYPEADQAACQMEHSVTSVILDRFIRFAEFVEICPRGGSQWVAGFGYRCDRNADPANCEECIEAALGEVRLKKQKELEHPMTKTVLRDLRPGQKGRVLKVSARGETGKRLIEMGINAGALVEVVRIAPFGDPIDVKVKGYHLSLRKDEAAGIEIETLQ